jgi:hypothetical protein
MQNYVCPQRGGTTKQSQRHRMASFLAMTQKLHEPKVGKFHQSQQPRQSLQGRHSQALPGNERMLGFVPQPDVPLSSPLELK